MLSAMAGSEGRERHRRRPRPPGFCGAGHPCLPGLRLAGRAAPPGRPGRPGPADGAGRAAVWGPPRTTPAIRCWPVPGRCPVGGPVRRHRLDPVAFRHRLRPAPHPDRLAAVARWRWWVWLAAAAPLAYMLAEALQRSPMDPPFGSVVGSLAVGGRRAARPTGSCSWSTRPPPWSSSSRCSWGRCRCCCGSAAPAGPSGCSCAGSPWLPSWPGWPRPWWWSAP
jgi:hypothetical protein